MIPWQAELFARRRRGVQLGIDRLRLIDAKLNHPSSGKVVVQVVGTNGKGSTAAMLAHGLKRLDQKVGLYTSPHLHQINERIQINGTRISDTKLKNAIERVVAIERELAISLTFFEILTFAALVIFESEPIRYVVLEAGLGGRLDATRIRTAALHLITPIGIDHQAYLGNTIAEIAHEKAAVMQPKTPCISVDQKADAKRVIEEVAQQTGARLEWARPLNRIPQGMYGDFQRINAGLACAGLRFLASSMGFLQISDSIVDNTHWPGRFEQHLIGKGEVIFDVAHNLHGVSALFEQSQGSNQYDQIFFGCTMDKDAKNMVATLRKIGRKILFVPPPAEHDGCDLKSIADASDTVFRGPLDHLLLDTIRASVDAGHKILICGSHFIVAPIRAHLLGVSPGGIDTLDLSDPVRRRRQPHTSVDNLL